MCQCIHVVKCFLSLNETLPLKEYSADMTHTIAKKEKVKKPNEGVTLTNVSPGGEQAAQCSDRGR